VVDVQRRDVGRRVAAAARIAPLDHDERSPIGSNLATGQLCREQLSQTAPWFGHRQTVSRFPQRALDRHGRAKPAW